MKNYKISYIIIVILYLVIGLINLIDGAGLDSRFFYFDNLLVKFNGIILIISSIGLLFKKEIARKGIVVALSLCLIEMSIGVPQNMEITDLVFAFIFLLIVYVSGLLYFGLPESIKVKISTILKKVIIKIPGFRTGSTWKRIIAIIMYLFLMITMLGITGVTLFDKVLAIFEWLMLIGIPYVLITNVGSARNKLPLFNKKTVMFNILGIFIVSVIIITSLVGLESLKSPEQKRSYNIAIQQDTERKVAENLDLRISTLGDINILTIDKKDEVEAIRASYEALTSNQKELITNFAILESAERKITEFQAADKSSDSIKQVEYISAVGNLYEGVVLYIEEDGQMVPAFSVLEIKSNIKNDDGTLIQNGVLVKEIDTDKTYWKDVDRMIKDSIYYYVKRDDPHLPIKLIYSANILNNNC